MSISVSLNDLIISQQSGALAAVEKLTLPFKVKYRIGRIVDKSNQALAAYWKAYGARYRECGTAFRIERIERDGVSGVKEVSVTDPSQFNDPQLQWRLLPEHQATFTTEEEELRKELVTIPFDPIPLSDLGDDIKTDSPLSSILWMFSDNS